MSYSSDFLKAGAQAIQIGTAIENFGLERLSALAAKF